MAAARGLWQHGGMANDEPRIPHVGDHVFWGRRKHNFRVVKVNTEKEWVALESLDCAEMAHISQISFGSLRYPKRKREDFSQAAARIVREATKG